MNPILVAFLVVDGLLFLGIVLSVLFAKKNGNESETVYVKAEKMDLAGVETVKEEVSEPVVEQKVVEEPKQEVKEEIAQVEEKEDVEETAENEEVVENESEEDENEDIDDEVEDVAEEEVAVANGLNIPKSNKPQVPFYTKILQADDKIKLFYNEIRNQFKSYRGINARVSKKCDSFRKGRELIAKLSFSGKTMKLYLKLNPEDFNVNVYHHKNVGDKKAYAEVPLLLRVRSDRSYKYAITLINEMMKALEVEPKKRYLDVDYIEYLKSLEALQ